MGLNCQCLGQLMAPRHQVLSVLASVIFKHGYPLQQLGEAFTRTLTPESYPRDRDLIALGQSLGSYYIYFFFFFSFSFFGCVGSLLCVGFLQLQRAGATLCCGAQASHCGGFSCCGAQALGARASVVVACRLSRCGSRALESRLSSCGARALERRLGSCGARALLLCAMWDLPGPGLEPLSPALAGGFLTTTPPRRPYIYFLSSLGDCSVCSGLETTDLHEQRISINKISNSSQIKLFKSTVHASYFQSSYLFFKVVYIFSSLNSI